MDVVYHPKHTHFNYVAVFISLHSVSSSYVLHWRTHPRLTNPKASHSNPSLYSIRPLLILSDFLEGSLTIMNSSLQCGIIETYQQSLSWDQSFSVQHNDTIVNLSTACKTSDFSSLCEPDKPKNMPHSLIYRFNTSFAGNQCWSSLKKMIKDSLPGADFI